MSEGRGRQGGGQGKVSKAQLLTGAGEKCTRRGVIRVGGRVKMNRQIDREVSCDILRYRPPPPCWSTPHPGHHPALLAYPPVQVSATSPTSRSPCWLTSRPALLPNSFNKKCSFSLTPNTRVKCKEHGCTYLKSILCS